MLSASGGSSINGVAVTSSNTVPFTPCRAIYVGTGGNLSIQFGIKNSSNTFSNTVFMNVPSGSIVPVRAQYIFTDTTANNLVILY